MATYLIGDIQGCYQSFRKLLKAFQFDPQQDTLYLAGDLINRGPQSLATMEFVLSHPGSIKAILGNHDLHFLAVAYQTRKANRKDTFHDILTSSSKDAIMIWLEQQPLALQLDIKTATSNSSIDSNPTTCFLAHAGLPPFWSVPQAIKYSQEVTEVLTSTAAQDFYREMYGNQPRLWETSLSGSMRLRMITNLLTRMRYLDKNKGLDLESKQPLGQQPSELIPWFEFENPNYQAKIAFGHWAALAGKTPYKRLIALDTGCVWGGQLSAYRLQDERYFRVAAAE